MTQNKSTQGGDAPSMDVAPDPAEVARARAILERQAAAEQADATYAELTGDIAERLAAGEGTAIPTDYHERLDEVAGALQGVPDLTSIDQLIADARARLTGAAPASNDDDGELAVKVEVSDAGVANALAAERAQLKRQVSMYEERLAEIDGIFVNIVGDADAVTINGATVFTYKPSTSRVLDQVQVKKLFPDTPENAELWKDQTSRRKNWK